MLILKKIIQIGLIPTLIGVIAFAQAATNGTIGANSTGSMNLSVTVPKIIVITNITDPAAATFNGTNPVNLSGSLCVGTNSAAGYSITATSANPGSSNTFNLSDGTNPVPYNVAWATTAGATTGGTAFGSSGATLTFAGGSVPNIACSADNASVVISVPAANLQAVPASIYTDTLTLYVQPQ
ncbi:MAG: hypothetical protein P8019_17265 [Gammaproteobacteria bacterium]|jgi:hypothetical protein